MPPASVQYGAMPPGGGMYGPAPPPAQQPTTYLVQGGFDAGARFDGISKPNIPVSFLYFCVLFHQLQYLISMCLFLVACNG